MRSAKFAIAVLLLVFVGLAAGVVVSRSLIPQSVHGRIDVIERRFEKERGVDDVYLVRVDGRRYRVDTEIGDKLVRGMRVDKNPWDRVLTTSRGRIPLRPSRDVKGMAAVLPIVLWAGIVLLIRRGEIDEPHH